MTIEYELEILRKERHYQYARLFCVPEEKSITESKLRYLNETINEIESFIGGL